MCCGCCFLRPWYRSAILFWDTWCKIICGITTGYQEGKIYKFRWNVLLSYGSNAKKQTLPINELKGDFFGQKQTLPIDSLKGERFLVEDRHQSALGFWSVTHIANFVKRYHRHQPIVIIHQVYWKCIQIPSINKTRPPPPTPTPPR